MTTGLRGLLTEKTSAVLTLGYVNGFYSNGASTSGFLGSTYLDLAFTARLTQLSRAVVGFRHDFVNAVISQLRLRRDRLRFLRPADRGAPRARSLGPVRLPVVPGRRPATRRPAGNRVDNFFQFGATLDYFLRNWAYLGVGYSLLDNRSNKPNDEYLKQQVFARLGVTY